MSKIQMTWIAHHDAAAIEARVLAVTAATGRPYRLFLCRSTARRAQGQDLGFEQLIAGPLACHDATPSHAGPPFKAVQLRQLREAITPRGEDAILVSLGTETELLHNPISAMHIDMVFPWLGDTCAGYDSYQLFDAVYYNDERLP